MIWNAGLDLDSTWYGGKTIWARISNSTLYSFQYNVDLLHLVEIMWQVADHFLLDLVSLFKVLRSIVVY